MSIYGAMVIFLCFVFGHGKEDYARIFALLCMLVTALLVNFSKVKEIVTSIAERNGGGDVDFFSDFINFFKHRSYILFIIAALVMTVSYFASVFVVKRKRGVV